MGRLERHLDPDLIAKIAAGWKLNHDPKPLKKQKLPRSATSYRWFKRNFKKHMKG